MNAKQLSEIQSLRVLDSVYVLNHGFGKVRNMAQKVQVELLATKEIKWFDYEYIKKI